jgi:hypothetical protein
MICVLPFRSIRASARPLDRWSSKTHAPTASGVAMTQSSGLPNASHQARIVRRSRLLGARPPIGCVCMKPMTSRRDSSRRSVHAPSAATLAGAPLR